MQKPSICLWFDHQGEEAAKFYTSLFTHSKLRAVARYGKSAAEISGQKEGSVMTVDFELEGLKFQALNGGPLFQFTPALSLFVWCETEKEIDSLWKSLSQEGEVLWELKAYPWSEKYGWCRDRFGVYWQLILGKNKQKIAPAILFTGPLFGQGEKAVHFYTSQFPHSKIESLHHDPETKTILHSVFSLNGLDFVLMEGKGDSHPMTLATSFVVRCDTQEEIDQYWQKLSLDGETGQCGWLTDAFGISWQVIPTLIEQLMAENDSLRAERMMNALLKMTKLDIQELKKAYAGDLKK